MMFVSRFVSLSAIALLLVNVKAAPVPYEPAEGEIVHIAPINTSGAGRTHGGGPERPHPHIALGKDEMGRHIVAPVTTDHNSQDLKPHMPVPASTTHQLNPNSRVRLDHTVVDNHHDIVKSEGRHAGTHMDAAGVHAIKEAKSLVQAHDNAASAHRKASQGFRDLHHQHAAHANDQTDQGRYHQAQAKHYGDLADHHHEAAESHRHAATNVTGPNATAKAHAHDSERHATDAHNHLTAVQHHHTEAQKYPAGHATGQHHHEQVQAGLKAANKSSQHALFSAHQSHHT
jgi:hypothetical protein